MANPNPKNPFKPGNPGKPKGTVSFAKREIAIAARELIERHAPEHFRSLFAPRPKPSVALMKVRQDAIEFLAERAYGKAPLKVTLGGTLDPNSPEGILLTIAGQSIPGAMPGESEKGDEDASSS